MRKLVFVSFLAASVGATAAMAEEWTGYISDAHCGAAHDKVSDANTKCVAACLKKGSDPVFVHDGKVLTFEGDSVAKAKDFAGQEVKINGSLGDNGAVKIESIEKSGS